jgi:hypothetical protein
MQKVFHFLISIHLFFVLSHASADQEIPLHEGWNLFSFSINTIYYDSVTPPNVAALSNTTYMKVDSLNDVMHSIDGQYDIIRNFDINGASTFDPNVPSFFNTLHYLAPGYGYHIKMNSSGTLSLTGVYAAPSDTRLMESGWNLVGCWHQDVQYVGANPPSVPLPSGVTATQVSSISDIFSAIDGKYSVIIKYDTNGAGIFDPQLPVYLNSLHYIAPGYGYWIKMTEPAYLHY